VAKSKKPTGTTRYPLDGLFPNAGKDLIGGTGRQFIENLGEEAAKKVILSVLMGENLRARTEFLTRRRLLLTSAAVLSTFARGFGSDPAFQAGPSRVALEQLKLASSSDKVRTWPAQWLLGLTGKSVQNVLRSDSSTFGSYLEEFEKAIADSAALARQEFGEMKLRLEHTAEGQSFEATLGWPEIHRITTAIGAQTLAVRGSDKSLYGKLFEKLILGTVLTLLGFKQVSRAAVQEKSRVFWLSDSRDTRESDATVLIDLGRVARFDIGFIGSGNSEISKDKLSRFGQEVTLSGSKAASTTFVIVDRLPQTSKTIEAARSGKAIILQMSMQFWIKELARELERVYHHRAEVLEVSDNDLQAYLELKLSRMDVASFASTLELEDVMNAEVPLLKDELEDL